MLYVAWVAQCSHLFFRSAIIPTTYSCAVGAFCKTEVISIGPESEDLANLSASIVETGRCMISAESILDSGSSHVSEIKDSDVDFKELLQSAINSGFMSAEIKRMWRISHQFITQLTHAAHDGPQHDLCLCQPTTEFVCSGVVPSAIALQFVLKGQQNFSCSLILLSWSIYYCQ